MGNPDTSSPRSSTGDEPADTQQHSNTTQPNDDDTEPWVGFFRRATHTADHLMYLRNIESWVTKHRRLLWRQASVVAKPNESRWTRRLSTSHPDLNIRHHGHRRQVRQMKRWDDDLNICLEQRLTATRPNHEQTTTQTTTRGYASAPTPYPGRAARQTS